MQQEPMNGSSELIIQLLKATRDENPATWSLAADEEIIQQLGIEFSPDGRPIIDSEQRIDLACQAVNSGAELERVVEALNWKDFERLVASIVEANDFRCVQSFRRRGYEKGKGMEIDVIGFRGNLILSIDAKMWGIRSGKAAALNKAAMNQRKRTQQLATHLQSWAVKLGKLSPGKYHILPLLVTWLVEEVEFNEGIPIVPVFKLNSFLRELDMFKDRMIVFESYLEETLE